jgi:predicted O-methyltransferase YrrM
MKTRNEFADFLTENNYKMGIEIGSYKGVYSKYLLDNWKGYLYMVDVWMKLPESEYVDISNQENPKEIIGEVFDNLIGYEDRTTLIRGSSRSTSHLFPDEFFDFIYIDANHKYQYVINDLQNWYTKLKSGGVLAGHDWIADYDEEQADKNGDVHVWTYNAEDPPIKQYTGLFGVNAAVKEFCEAIDKEYKITTDEYFGTWYFKK